MKLKLDYYYRQANELAGLHGSGFVVEESPINVSKAIDDVYQELLKKDHHGGFEIIPISVSVVEDCPSTWVIVLSLLGMVLFSGVFAAIICTGIITLMK